MSEFNDIQDNNDNKIFIIEEYKYIPQGQGWSQVLNGSQQSYVSYLTRSDNMDSNYFDFLNDYGVNDIQDIGNIDKILLENIKNKSNSNETNEKYKSLFNNFDLSNPLLNKTFLDEIIKTQDDYIIDSDGKVNDLDAKLNEKKDILNDFINEDPQCINTSDNDVKSDDEDVKEVEVASEISDNTISYTINRATKEERTRRISERNKNRLKLLAELNKAKKIEEEEEEERKRKEALQTEGSVATGIFSNSQCSSKFLFELSNKINLNPKHFGGSTEDGPKNFSNLLNTCCKLRHLPDTKQGDSRELSSLNISEKTQFSDIWGKKMLKYARYEEGDGLNYEKIEIPKCYITKVELVPFEIKAESGGKERACSEMEHKLPCVTAFSRAPNYILLSKYKPKNVNGINYLKLWNDFVNNENNFGFLHSLYVTINFRKFDNDNVFMVEENIKAEFKRHIFSGEQIEQIEEKEEKIFNWVFNVIRYWLHEFAYSHHISNQEKSIYEIGLNKKKCDTFFNKLKIAWESRNSAPADVERRIVGEQIKAIFSGPNASNKKKLLLINSLVHQFRYMDEIIKQIDKAYDAITSVKNIIDNNNIIIDTSKEDTINKCKKILIMKNIILAYKLYKNNLKKEQILSKKKKRENNNNEGSVKKKAKKVSQDKILVKELLDTFNQTKKEKGSKNKKKGSKKKGGKKGGTKKRVRFKVSRKVYRKLEHK